MDVEEPNKPQDTETRRSVSVKDETFDVKSEDTLSSAEASSAEIKTKRTRISLSHLPSVKEQALTTFTEIKESLYQYEDLGESQQQDVMACECKPLKTGAASPS
jgi:hypothetical protein